MKRVLALLLIVGVGISFTGCREHGGGGHHFSDNGQNVTQDSGVNT